MAAARFSPELCKQIVKLFADGLTLGDVATAADVGKPTLERWLTRGRKESGTPHAQFAHDVDAAKKDALESYPMDREELIRVVSRSARRGSIPAMKLRDEMLQREEAPDEDEPAAPDTGSLDELAERRRRAA